MAVIKQEELQLLRSIVEGTASVTGGDFFRSLVGHLASTLHVRYAFVAECGDEMKSKARTLALWTGEEQGIHGSRNYVKNHFGNAQEMKLKPEHAKFSSYFNIDNGTGKIRGIYLQGNEAARPIFNAWFEPFDDMIDNTTITIRNTGGTDHLAFDAVGLPGFQFIQDPIAYGTVTHHTNMDTYERLEEGDLKQMAVIVASFVYHAAMRNDKMPRKPVAVVSPK